MPVIPDEPDVPDVDVAPQGLAVHGLASGSSSASGCLLLSLSEPPHQSCSSPPVIQQAQIAKQAVRDTVAHIVMQLASPAMLFFRPQRYSYFQTLHPPRSTEA
jgi:hypothetical protein